MTKVTHKATLLLATLLLLLGFVSPAVAQGGYQVIGFVTFSQGGSVPGSCANGSFFELASSGQWYICVNGAYAAVSGGAGGSIAGSGTIGTIPVFVTNTTTIGNSKLTDNGTTLAYSGTGGFSLTAGTTASWLGTFGALPAVPPNTNTQVVFGPSGHVYVSDPSIATGTFEQVAVANNIPGTWISSPVPAAEIADLSGTYQALATEGTANFAALLGSNGFLVPGEEPWGNWTNQIANATATTGTFTSTWTIGDFGASPGTAWVIQDNATSTTDTSTDVLIGSTGTSRHTPLRIQIEGVDQEQWCWQAGPQGETVIGSAVACGNINQSPFAKFVVMSSTNGHTIERQYKKATTDTGIMLEQNNATLAGTGWFFAKGCAGASQTDTGCGTGTIEYSIRGDGLATFTGLTLSGITGVSPNCLQADTTGHVTGTGSGCGGGGSSALSSITAATVAATINSGNFPITWNWAQTTAAQAAFTIGEATAATGAGDVQLQVTTIAGTAATALNVTGGAGASGAAAANVIAATGGAGGAAATATSAGNTGAGYSFTTGAGSAGGATSGNGGAAGAFAIVTSAGGNAAVGSTNGNGGDVTISLGPAGTGGTAARNGQVIISGGSLSVDLGAKARPGIIFGSDTAGFYRNAANQITYVTGGNTDTVNFSTTGVEVTNTGGYSFSSTGQATGAIDSGWNRRAAKEVAPCSNTNCSDAAGFIYSNGNRVFVTADFTTASTTLATITGLSISPASTIAHNITFRCSLMYSIATANAAVSFGVQAATNAPTNVNASGEIWTNTTSGSITPGTLNGLTTTTATTVVSATPAATVGTILRATIDGTFELPASANTINIDVATGSASDSVTVKRGSMCQYF